MRGIRELRRGSEGIGGFTEAVLALMVVTLAVILLSASFSITGIEVLRQGDESSLSEGCEDVWNLMADDELLWDGGAVVLSSFITRSFEPYSIPEGLNGYEVFLLDISNGSLSSTMICEGAAITGAEVRSERHPVLLRTDPGTIHASLLDVRVW
ncbi:MAG: hypothetical protein LLG16_09350 [Euryarchaeota archaeon]|nr:hypothetical protein [Euryarchaeota archaeon]